MGLSLSAAEPSGYYSSCINKSGAALLSQLCNVVGDHTVISYDGLWEAYKTTDVRANGTVWDMYATTNYKFGTNQCGNYKNVGDCYNREHSMPKSWFNDAKPMYSDAFHLYPTDGKVNGQRSNYPFGECANGTTLAGSGSVKALGKLGKSTFSGYSGTVFEPDDEYKGDFARSYFYMAAAYNDKIKNWSTSESNLGGTTYPAFNSWSVNLLLKWHRQDPVSQKELDRNEAVYALQHNRNPFIDHPELAEYIWGDKVGQGWTGGVVDPELTLPVSGSTVNMGATMTGVSRNANVTVKGNNLTSSVAVSVSGAGFSVSTSSIAASSANSASGYSLTVTFNPSSTGTFTGTLKLTCGSLSSTVTLTGSATATIPAGPVTSISDDSFEAVWSNVGDDNGGKYTLDVKNNGASIAGYPLQVNAADERYVVVGLEPSTVYTYTVSSKTHSSQTVTVTTLEPIPSVAVLFDGDLVFETLPDEPSDIAELLLDIDNIFTSITITVNEPFQVSSDKSSWSQSITIDPEQDRFYMRLYSEETGVYSGTLVITAGDYRNDDVVFSGVVGTLTGLTEDFEADASGFSSYNGGTYEGNGAQWKLTNAGIYAKDNDPVHGGKQAVRFGKNTNSALEMVEDTENGIGTVTLWARKWSASEANATFSLEFSIDGGKNWQSVGSSSVSDTNYKQFTYTVNSTVPTRIRMRQTAGARWLVDDVEATANKLTGVSDVKADYHCWDAFCRGGRLVIEATERVEAVVYSLDGAEVFVGSIAPGETAFSVANGLYIVVVDDFARRVLVK